MQTEALQDSSFAPPRNGFMMKVFIGFAVLAVLSGAISMAGRLLGHSIAMAGHSDDPHPFEIVIGNNVLSIPGNEIRFESARTDGVAPRIDLYVAWPSMTGYSTGQRALFNNIGGTPSLIFMSIDDRMMSRDMSGRYEPIYASLIEQPGLAGPAGLTIHDFAAKSGYDDELLAVGPVADGSRFVARCLSGEAGGHSLAPCERDIHVGRELTLTYRFPRELLGSWQRLDEAVKAKAASYLLSQPQPRSTSSMAIEKL